MKIKCEHGQKEIINRQIIIKLKEKEIKGHHQSNSGNNQESSHNPTTYHNHPKRSMWSKIDKQEPDTNHVI